MNDEAYINELLNGYIDDELTTRQQTELKRLLLNDPGLAEKLDRMQRCQQLVKMAPMEKAPDDMLDRVKSAMTVKARQKTQQKTEQKTETRSIVDILASDEGLTAGSVIAAPDEPAPAPAARPLTFGEIFKTAGKAKVTKQLQKIKADIPEHVEKPQEEKRESVIAYAFRRYASTAALFALLILLVFVVVKIVAPVESSKPEPYVQMTSEPRFTIPEDASVESVLNEAEVAKEPAIKLPAALENDLTATENPAAAQPEETTTPAVPAKTLRSSFQLNLIAKDSLIAENQLKALLRDNPEIKYQVLESQPQSAAYSLDLKLEQLNTFLMGMENLWDNFTDASLAVQTDKAGKPIVVQGANLSQIAAITEQQNEEKRIKAANYYAMLNNVENFWAESEDMTDNKTGDILDNVPIPKTVIKPVLTSDEHADTPTGDSTEARVSLTIVISMDN
jgi:hypothetical protein